MIEKAASCKKGHAEFFVEEFGGFTHSLVEECTRSNNDSHFLSATISSVIVKTDMLDNICSQNSFAPNFIKIDIEGADYDVLKGASNILKNVNGLMVEVSKHKNDGLSLLTECGFKQSDGATKTNNYFFVKVS